MLLSRGFNLFGMNPGENRAMDLIEQRSKRSVFVTTAVALRNRILEVIAL